MTRNEALASYAEKLKRAKPAKGASEEKARRIMQIVCESQTVKVERYALVFEWNGLPGAGFSFSCDKQGTPLREGMRPEALQNLEGCLSGEYAVTPHGVKDYSYTYWEPAQGRCSCGKIVELVGFTNECECGLMYNFAGQSLAPRSQWED